MQDWHTQRFFSDDLLVNRVGESEYVPLGVLLRVVVDPSRPFSSALRPRQAHVPSAPAPQQPSPTSTWSYEQPVPSSSRQFTNDYDPFRQESSPLSASPGQQLGGPISRQVSASHGTWGLPLREHSPASFLPSPAAPQAPETWKVSSGNSSRQASLSHSPFEYHQISQPSPYGSMDLASPDPALQQPWHAIPQSTVSFDETRPLLGEPEQQKSFLLNQMEGMATYSTSPVGSGDNLVGIISQSTDRRQPSADHSYASRHNSEAVPPLLQTATSPEAPPLHLETSHDFILAQPMEKPATVPPPSAAKGKSKRALAREAKEAAQLAAEEATIPQPSDLPPSSTPKTTPKKQKSNVTKRRSSQAEPSPALEVTTNIDAGEAPEVEQMQQGWGDMEIEDPIQQTASPPPSPREARKSAPWAVGREEGGGGSSLRDIQAREAKEVKVREAAERQRRANAAAAEAAQLAAAANEVKAVLPTASAWAASAAEVSASTSASVSVWSKPSAAPSTGKSLKDIQEEETKRRQAAKTAQQQALGGTGPVRAAYAGSVGPPQPSKPVASTSSGPWQTVGSGGKVAAPPPGVARPAAANASSSKPRTPASAPVRPAAPLKTVSSNAVSAAKPSDTPAPSPELVKWVRGALQGFSANVDDFVQLLFSFPLETDDFTREIISDTVYANSKTLDGKRFAADFLTRRKADARGVLGGKVSSMADAVKVQPVRQTAEPFKVVKAKGGKKK